jgi:hypothetical protein
MIPLAAFEAVIDASGVAQQIEALLPAGVRRRQLTVRTLRACQIFCVSLGSRCPFVTYFG